MKKRKPIQKHSTDHMFYALNRDRMSSCEIIMPNVHVHNWNECDALMLMKSGYCHEVEMKLTKSDFKADFKKTNWWLTDDDPAFARPRQKQGLKHEDCLANKQCFPNRFSFLVPEGLVELDDIPDYAGLMYFKRYEGEYGRIQIVRDAKLLHKKKLTDNKVLYLTKKFVYRYNKLAIPSLETNYSCDSEDHF